jgi:demethylmenaquinone methyltransferase/2-methoxy-6-polyprenyl-1,4-benzoquinol methylase
MKMLDVGVGTGLVAREGITLVGDPRLVFGLDPSAGMVRQVGSTLKIQTILGVAEQLPITSGQFSFLSMGYALRHLADVNRAFAEFFRVLEPGGRLCILEITAPRRRLGRMLLRAYMRGLVPLLTRVATGREQSRLLWQYYWDTIDACVPPETLLHALRRAGFVDADRHVELGIFSEYTARKPD